LAVLPTETVYGLGADAADPRAVARVYAVKGRPADHPVIVHLADATGLPAWASRVPGYARRLAEGCWPGPLTLVLPRHARVGDHVTGGQATVGLRVPDHALTLQVLASFGGGVAAPSANRFGRVSPTTTAHVLGELADALVPGADVVLEGGACPVGVESTILDCTGDAPVLLRPGAVTAAVVAEVGGVAPARGTGRRVRAPGTLPAHYAPQARVRLVTPDALVGAPSSQAPTVGLLALADVETPAGVVRLAAPDDTQAYARGLYAALREADALGLQEVWALPPPSGALAEAVRDRLSRAAASR
jgi:L-threonylcarbamoyladenylate synthase